MNLFGSKKKKSAPPPQQGAGANDAIKVLREKSNDLDKRESHLQKQIDACTAKAKEHARAKNKKGNILSAI